MIYNSVIEERSKPVDASDVADFDAAKAEIVRLRAMMKEYSEPNIPALEQAAFKIRMEEGTFLPPGTTMGRDDMPEGRTQVIILCTGHPCYELLVEAALPSTSVALVNWDGDCDGKRHVDDFIPAFVSLMKELGPAYKKLAFVDNGRANENMTPELTSEGFGLLIGHLVPPDMMDNSMQTAGWWAFFIDW